MIVVGALAGWLAAPALAGWKLNSTTTASIAYNQGITFDPSVDTAGDPSARRRSHADAPDRRRDRTADSTRCAASSAGWS